LPSPGGRVDSRMRIAGLQSVGNLRQGSRRIDCRAHPQSNRAMNQTRRGHGDEVAPPLQVPGANGDANLRFVMDWSVTAAQEADANSVLEHWRKLGRFRRADPVVGAGAHHEMQADPYVFSRVEVGGPDRVVIGLDQGTGAKTIPVGGVFPDGTALLAKR
jgi:hypothetical protein